MVNILSFIYLAGLGLPTPLVIDQVQADDMAACINTKTDPHHNLVTMCAGTKAGAMEPPVGDA